MAEQEQDRSESATPHKLTEARKKGSVAKSVEISSVVVMAAWLLALRMWGGAASQGHAVLDIGIFSQMASLSFSESGILAWGTRVCLEVMVMLAPFLVAVVVAGILGHWGQTGPIFSFHPVKPDFNRLNPAEGLKKLFSTKALFDLGKNTLKLVLFSWILYLVLNSMRGELMGLLQADARSLGKHFLNDLTAVAFKLIMALAAVALLDLLFTRWDFAQKMRMSMREVKQEFKQREGDPKIKARIRELQNEMRKRGKGMKNLPDADVLVTNPTHLAVALQYKRGDMAAPVIVAKGAGDLVPKMKQVARAHGVMIVENKPLARALFKVNMDSPVPGDQFAAVARLLVWVYAQKEAREKSRRPLKGE